MYKRQDDIAAIEKWVEMGASLPHKIEIDPSDRLRWCFQPPMAPAVELLHGQDVIDALVEKALAQAGITPAAEATRSAWLRRVTFDLTGLPPTPEQITAFEADESDKAYEHVVDRLLASPAYGERQARRWMDLMRYAETKAHEFDFPILNAWQYRDYVIRAFGADVPYDRLVTELLAGDLVDEPRLDPTGRYDESPLGTGAWFLGDEVHSPVTPRGDQADRVAHQVEVLSKSLLGLGVSCARCHDHKFDPISAEDYHALAGFALSTAPRQLRFETDRANRVVASDLDAFQGRSQRAMQAAVASAVRDAAQGAEDALTSAISVDLEEGSSEETKAPSLVGFDAWVQSQGASTRLPIDLLIEGFESGDYDGPYLGPWKATGDAFGTAPLHKDDIAPGEAAMRPRGNFVVSTYAKHPGKGQPSNGYTGTLTSAPFPMVRSNLHFLVNGGRQESVRVELVDAETGDVIGTARGTDSNAFRAVTIARPGSATAAPPLVRIRIVDEAEGHWGQIGADQFVLSDLESPAMAMSRAQTPAQWMSLLSGVDGDTPARELEWRFAWLSATSGEPRAREALAALFPETYSPDHTSPDRTSPDPGPAEAFVDYSSLSGARWIPNGPTFGRGPVPAGHASLQAEANEYGGVAIAARPGVRAQASWKGLRVHPESATKRGGNLKWLQAGRTLVTPGGVSAAGRFAHLVRGQAKLVAPIASHKMLAGPLHGASLKSIDTKGIWRWVEHSMPSAKGHHVHFEWTALKGEELEIARTVELEDGEAVPALAPSRWIAQWALDEGLETGTMEGRAAIFQALLLDAVELLQRGGIEDRILSDDARAGLYGLVEFVSNELPTVQSAIAAALDTEVRGLCEIQERRQLESKLAPAALDLEGRDEHILARGDWQQPTARAPRGAPKVLRPSAQEPGGEPINNGSGSGRLRLARSLLASDSKIIQRVWVNRLWQSMFGRGIVATTDDFGAMGALPSHPALLDHLAISLEHEGWSTKAMLRRMALSKAYRRSTTASPSAAQLDPTNALLSHMSVRRLEAEEVRDALLAVSSELRPDRFGKPVPIHLTPFMDGRGRPGKSGPLDGAGRRSIYIEARRNFPHPFLTVFDQPSPSTCHGTRTSANVPAQALAMLNDPFVEDRAVAFAQSVERGTVDRETLDTMWIRALGRRPHAKEAELVLQALGAVDDASAAKIDIAHVLFNTKEFLFLR